MKLFRRVLLSLFPEELTANTQHPVSMFLSLVSPKQFFSLIHRRVTENFRLNLYDIALDPFEIKIGFGDQPTLQVKDIDQYYGYGVVAQINGWNFYPPGTLATAASLVVAYQGKDIWKKYDRIYGYTCIMTVYLLTFMFVSRLRIFPEGTKEQRYQWCIDLFFDFYLLVARQYGLTIDDEILAQFKKDLLVEVQLFFFLFYFYQKVGDLFAHSFLEPKEFYSWLFADDLKNEEFKRTIETFLSNRKEITIQKQFGGGDINMCKLIFPAEIPLRQILQGEDGRAVVDRLLPEIYDAQEMKTFLRSFLKDGSQLDTFLVRVLDRRTYQQHFFQGMKKMSMHEFRMQVNYEEEKEIDAFISSLESGSKPGELQMPESLKKESQMMDKLMNFYLVFLGGLRTGRGDAFGLRLLKPLFISGMMEICIEPNLKQEALQWYGGLLYTYSKNVFYYAYAYEHIRAGKEVFRLPYKSGYKEVYAHMYLLKLFDEHFLYTLFQDFATSGLVITVTQRDILKTFKHLFHERLRACIDTDDAGMLLYMYGAVGKLIDSETSRNEHLINGIDHEDDVTHLREQIYAVDFHLWIHSCELLSQTPALVKVYGKSALIGICALLRETLFGFLLYMTYVQREERTEDVSYKSGLIKQVYISDVLQISSSRNSVFLEMIDTLLLTYHPLLELWIKLDDNIQYFKLGLENRQQYITNKTPEHILRDFSGDDVVWCRGWYKTISYYNKRIVRPK